MRNLIPLLAVVLLAASCTITRSSDTTASSRSSGFNDGDDTWRHTDESTEKTKTANGTPETHTQTDELIAQGAGKGAEWIAGALDASLLGKKIAGRLVQFIAAELLDAPPAALPLYENGRETLVPTSNFDEVHGIVVRLEFPYTMGWLQDDRQSSDDANNNRDLTLRIRAWGHWQNVFLTQDGNYCYGWIETKHFKWPRGKSIRIAVYDADAFFDDGMVDFEIPSVDGYYLLNVKDEAGDHIVGKLGFLSESDIALMRQKYMHLALKQLGVGMKVVGVDAGSNAEQAGIVTGDIITSYGGFLVRSQRDLDLAKTNSSGPKIEVGIRRAGVNYKAIVKPGQLGVRIQLSGSFQ